MIKQSYPMADQYQNYYLSLSLSLSLRRGLRQTRSSRSSPKRNNCLGSKRGEPRPDEVSWRECQAQAYCATYCI